MPGRTATGCKGTADLLLLCDWLVGEDADSFLVAALGVVGRSMTGAGERSARQDAQPSEEQLVREHPPAGLMLCLSKCISAITLSSSLCACAALKRRGEWASAQ